MRHPPPLKLLTSQNQPLETHLLLLLLLLLLRRSGALASRKHRAATARVVRALQVVPCDERRCAVVDMAADMD